MATMSARVPMLSLLFTRNALQALTFGQTAKVIGFLGRVDRHPQRFR